MRRRGDMTPGAQDSPQFLLSALPGTWCSSGTSVSVCQSVPPSLCCSPAQPTAFHLRAPTGASQLAPQEAAPRHSSGRPERGPGPAGCCQDRPGGGLGLRDRPRGRGWGRGNMAARQAHKL